MSPLASRIRLLRIHNAAVVAFAAALAGICFAVGMGLRHGAVPAFFGVLGVVAVATSNVCFALAFLAECKARRAEGEHVGQWSAAILSLRLFVPRYNLRLLAKRWSRTEGLQLE